METPEEVAELLYLFRDTKHIGRILDFYEDTEPFEGPIPREDETTSLCCDLYFGSEDFFSVFFSCAAFARLRRHLRLSLVAELVIRKRTSVIPLVRTIVEEHPEDHHPLFLFFRSCFVDYDFEDAWARVSEVIAEFQKSYFYRNKTDMFEKNSLYWIFSYMIKIYEKDDVETFFKQAVEMSCEAESDDERRARKRKDFELVLLQVLFQEKMKVEQGEDGGLEFHEAAPLQNSALRQILKLNFHARLNLVATGDRKGFS